MKPIYKYILYVVTAIFLIIFAILANMQITHWKEARKSEIEELGFEEKYKECSFGDITSKFLNN